MNKVSRLLILFVSAVVLTACIAAPVCADTFTIKSSPSNAAFAVTGNDVNYATGGSTPWTGDLPAGQYTINMFLSGYNSISGTFTVGSGRSEYFGEFITSSTGTTVPTSSSTASVLVYTYLEGGTALPGVVIYIDNNAFSSGTTAGNPAVLPISGLSAGTHEIRAVYNGQEQLQSFSINVGTSSVINLTFHDTAGRLDITSTPEGASVYLDGSFAKRTPCIIEGVTPGEHTVRVDLADYQTLSTTVKIKENETKQLTFPLTKVSGSGSVEIRSVPKTANIYLDGIWGGEGLLVNSKVDAGMHKVLFELEGYESKLIDVEVVSGKVLRVTEELKEGVTEDPLLGKTGITVICTNTQASVFLDGEKIGYTPLENSLDVTKNGKQQLTLKAAGYETYEETITLLPAQINVFEITLEKWGGEVQPTVTPTVEVTEVVTPFPTIPTLEPTTVQTIPATEVPASPMPIAGLLTGLAACVYLMKRS